MRGHPSDSESSSERPCAAGGDGSPPRTGLKIAMFPRTSDHKPRANELPTPIRPADFLIPQPGDQPTKAAWILLSAGGLPTEFLHKPAEHEDSDRPRWALLTPSAAENKLLAGSMLRRNARFARKPRKNREGFTNRGVWTGLRALVFGRERRSRSAPPRGETGDSGIRAKNSLNPALDSGCREG